MELLKATDSGIRQDNGFSSFFPQLGVLLIHGLADDHEDMDSACSELEAQRPIFDEYVFWSFMVMVMAGRHEVKVLRAKFLVILIPNWFFL